MTEDETLSKLIDLADLLAHAKETEDLAKHKRIEIEEQIAALIPGPEKGQKTVALPEGIKITVTRGFNYKADVQCIENLMQNPLYPPPVKTKTTRELDASGYEWYMENHPDLFSLISKHVTVTPKKVAVELKAGKQA